MNDNHKQQLNQPKFQCDQCSKTFKSKGDLIRYVESVHYQERFECTGCDLSFSRRDNLEVLRLKQHQKTCYVCETCGKKFKFCSELFRHSEESKCEILTCEICKNYVLVVMTYEDTGETHVIMRRRFMSSTVISVKPHSSEHQTW